MKKYYTLSLICILILSFQSCGVPATFVHIEPVIKSFEVTGTKSELYVKANNWMVENFTNAKSVIQFSDKEEGIVTGKYLFKESVIFDGVNTRDASIFAIIKLQVKDGASKITITPDDFNSYKSALLKEEYQYNETTARNQIAALISSYEEYMKTDTSTDW